MNAILITLGVIIVILGLVVLNYSVVVKDQYFWGLISDSDVQKPYSSWGIPLVIGGIILTIVGLVIKEEHPVHDTHRR